MSKTAANKINKYSIMPTNQPTMKQTRLTQEEFSNLQSKALMATLIIILGLATAIILAVILGYWTLTKLTKIQYCHKTATLLAVLIYSGAIISYFVNKNNLSIWVARNFPDLYVQIMGA
jgi:cytochrome c biogenesis protein CcdA